LQIAVEERSPSPKIIVFRKPMGTPATQAPPPEPGGPGGWDPSRLGNLAQWVAPVVSLLGVIITVGVVIHYHNAETAGRNSTLQINDLIDKKLNPAVEKINEGVDKKLDPINRKLTDLDEKISDVQGQLKRLGATVQQQKRKEDQQTSLAELTDPDRASRALATIRTEIQVAEDNARVLPISDLDVYRGAIQALPASTREYWMTVATIINYQSFLNQLNHEAPDPATVSRMCLGLTGGTGGSNVYSDWQISNCILDLDTTHNVLINSVVRNSVVRYHGGRVAMHNVLFVNCRFVLELTDFPQNPAHPDLLRALLDSDQKQVTLSTHS
jgi:flagellar biosynthesis chaperone FliJ